MARGTVSTALAGMIVFVLCLLGLVAFVNLPVSPPAPSPSAENCTCPTELAGAVDGPFNETTITAIRDPLECQVGEMPVGLKRLASGQLVDGACALYLIPNVSGGLPLDTVFDGAVTGPYDALELTTLGDEETCAPPLVCGLEIAASGLGIAVHKGPLALDAETEFGGAFYGTYDDLRLNEAMPAIACPPYQLCDYEIDAAGLVSAFSSTGPTVLLANATAGGGMSGPLDNLTLNIVSGSDTVEVTHVEDGSVIVSLVPGPPQIEEYSAVAENVGWTSSEFDNDPCPANSTSPFTATIAYYRIGRIVNIAVRISPWYNPIHGRACSDAGGGVGAAFYQVNISAMPGFESILLPSTTLTQPTAWFPTSLSSDDGESWFFRSIRLEVSTAGMLRFNMQSSTEILDNILQLMPAEVDLTYAIP